MYRLLVVEDHDDVRDLLCVALEEAGLSVTCVATLADGRRELESGGYDAVIANVVLPDGDGRDLIADAAARNVRGIVITANVATMQQLERDKISYFGKPFKLDDILSAIERLCGAQRR
jgi:DNA-binding response OmpR family regulator